MPSFMHRKSFAVILLAMMLHIFKFFGAVTCEAAAESLRIAVDLYLKATLDAN